jgi:hypothetical protein
MRPVFLLCTLLVPFATLVPLAASAQTTVEKAAEFRAAPDGALLASVRPGTPVVAGAAKGAWTAVTLEGFVHRSVLGGARDTFAISAGVDGAALRAAGSPSGKMLAEMRKGMGLHAVSRSGEWTRVRRQGWVRSASLTKAPAPAPERAPAPARREQSAPATPRAPRPAPPADTGGGRAASEPSPAPGALAVERRAELRSSPDGGSSVATIDSGARVTTLARDRGWVRVQVEGWVRAEELVPARGAVLTSVSAADLRADPERYRGEIVRWQVQVIALQTADPLRQGFAPDEPYLLARGPGAERSLLYLALPATLVQEARRIEPLATVLVTARVRMGRSEPSGVPLLDVQSIARR